MPKKTTKRKVIGLTSPTTGDRFYYTVKNTQNTTEKISLRKYNPRTRMHELFTETKRSLGRNEVKKRK